MVEKKYVNYGRAFGREARCRYFILAEIFYKFKCLHKIVAVQTANIVGKNVWINVLRTLFGKK